MTPQSSQTKGAPGSAQGTPPASKPSRWRLPKLKVANAAPGASNLARPSVALLSVSILLPFLLFGLAAWQNRRDVLHEAETRVERITQILHEHALKVFETHQLMLGYIDERLQGFDWSNPDEHEKVHQFLKHLRENAVQVAGIIVTDANGHIRASSEDTPAANVDNSDRDYFIALKAHDQPVPFVAETVKGRQSGELVFSLAQRLHGKDGAFDGVITISIKRSYFEDFYRGIEREYDHLVLLARDDGKVLANEPRTGLTELRAEAPFRKVLHTTGAAMATPAMFDGATRIFGYQKIGPYPVVIGFGVTWPSALSPWGRNLMAYGFVAFLSSLALLFVSGIALRHSALEAKATRRWRDTAALLQDEMSERLRVEEQLRQAQKMEAVGRLTGGVAHDFNNLLTIVIGSLDLLSRRLKNADPRFQTLVHNAMDGATRAAALTAQLLSFARQHPLDPKAVDANAIVRGMSNLLRQSLDESIEVEVVLASDLWTSYADPNQLENAILNLCVNAGDAMPDGGKLRIETANVALDTDEAAAHPDLAAGAYVTIAIIDTGTGMTPEVLSQAFEPFFTTKPVGKGTGLGLSQVYGFTKQSGGSATIASELGKGTTITIFLPRLQGKTSDAPSTDAVAEASAPAQSARTILIVEDEELVRRFSSSALEEAGYHVLEAATGPEAIALLRANPDITLLFTDIVLKGQMNGRTLASQAMALRPRLKVLYTSGYRKEANLSQASQNDAQFLAKPFTTAALAAKIEALLED